MKRLVICRHAKSSWKDLSLADRERPLNKRGKRDAPAMGRRLSKRKLVPGLIVSSPAKRARKTAGLLAAELEISKDAILVEKSIYGADCYHLLELINHFDNDCQCIMLVGHNPECTLLANLLGDLDLVNVPTSGMVLLDFPVNSWEDVAFGLGELVLFDFPKNREM